MTTFKAAITAAAFVAASMAGINSAQALTLSYSTTYNGAINVTTGGGANTPESVPGSDFYGNTFVAPTDPNFPTAPTYGFYDDYIFNITSAAGTNSVTSTINLGTLEVTNLQARLYALPGAFNPNTVPGGGCPGGCLASWSSTVTAANVTYTVLNYTGPLAPGSYVLEIRGDAVGANGGSYSGVLNLQAVPVPAAAWLFGSAVAGLGWLRRRAR
jgi:hypothetical protein